MTILIPVAPTIDKIGLRDLRVRVGQPFSLNARIAGEPAPDASWRVNGKSMPGHLIVETKGNATKVESKKSQRGDSGNYVLTVKNDSGVVTASAMVSVVGKLSLFTLYTV